MAIMLRNQSEAELASVQQEQTGNQCAVFSACAAIYLLTGIKLDPYGWSERLDRLPPFSLLKYRMYRNGPVTPLQHVNLIHLLTEEAGLPGVTATRRTATREELLRGLEEENQIYLVTIGWFLEKSPEITYGSFAINQNESKAKTGYHTMLLAAYDPDHISRDGLQRPWGFVNSWKSDADSLYWMQDAVFSQSWNIYTPLGGRRSVVTVTVQ